MSTCVILARPLVQLSNNFRIMCKPNLTWSRCIHMLGTWKSVCQRNAFNRKINFAFYYKSFRPSDSHILGKHLKTNHVPNRQYASVHNIDSDLLMKYLTSLNKEYETILEAYTKGDKGQNLNERKHFLTPIVDIYKQMVEKHSEMEELKQLVAEDGEMKSIADNDIKIIQEQIDLMQHEVLNNLVPDLKYDKNDVVLELNPGVGGEEAKLFTMDMYNVYKNYADFKGWRFETESSQSSDSGGVSRVRVYISGNDVFKTLKYESGIHRVQRVPKTEKAGRIHTSTSTVAILPQPTEIDIKLEPKDLEITAYRSSGPGGQSVNKLNTAVRILHTPTGMATTCQTSRSQIHNKKEALDKLRSSMYEKEFNEQMSQIRSQRKLQVGSRGRSEKIRTYNFPHNRVTDHRIHYSANLEGVLNGYDVLDELLQKLQEESRKEILIEILEEFRKKSL